MAEIKALSREEQAGYDMAGAAAGASLGYILARKVGGKVAPLLVVAACGAAAVFAVKFTNNRRFPYVRRDGSIANAP